MAIYHIFLVYNLRHNFLKVCFIDRVAEEDGNLKITEEATAPLDKNMLDSNVSWCLLEIAINNFIPRCIYSHYIHLHSHTEP